MLRAIVKLTTLLALSVFFGPNTFAEDTPASAMPKKADTAKGQAIASQVCAACHGVDGNAVSNAFPKLAGQHPEYIYKQLANFKAGERANAIMGPYAAALSDDDMHNLAGYFSEQVEKPASAQDAATVDLGRKIYRAGVAEKGVPACAGCHSPNGAGIPAQYPRLSGQWGEYAQAQLTAFKGGVRNNNVAMSMIAARLSDDEIKAVSDYVAGLR